MAFPPEFLRELEDRSRIEEIAGRYVNLKRRGKNLTGLCPFHSEKTPSFNIYPGNNSYYCFGCGKGGGVINFVMDAERLDFVEAVKWLAQRAGMPLPEQSWDDSLSKLRLRVLEVNREAGRFFYQTLVSPEGRAGLEYFQGRGLDPAAIKKFGLGYAPENGFGLVNHLRTKGYTVEEMTQADVARLSQRGNPYDRYRGRVMFPIFDLRGNVVAFGGRVLTDEKPKYINTSDTPVYHKSSGLFAMNLAKNSDSRQLILAEGYMDVIALHRAGFSNAIASLGTSLTEEQARIMKRYADEAVICYDSDEAGQKATQRAIPILKNAGLRVRVVTVPGGKDPDEFMRNYGKDGPLRFKQLLEGGGTDVEYRLQKLRDQYGLETEAGRARYLSEAVEQVLGKLRDPMEQDVYAGKLAEETGVGKDRILAAAGGPARREAKKEEKKLIRAQMEVAALEAGAALNPEKKEHMRAALAEEGLIAYLFLHQDKAEALQKLLPPEKFVTAFNRRVYAALLGKTIHGAATLTGLGEELSQAEMGELSRMLAQHRDPPVSGADAKEFVRLILREAGRTGTQWVKTASDGEILEDIARRGREQKQRR
ncbi:DNA primase [Acutalibacter sp.]|uniref:DNA primase n=1 Tax=Acutalibacter sp. TaxID=1918636 RepID=UPI00216E385D|nr:DNA primase [Acutalibacter sp.]